MLFGHASMCTCDICAPPHLLSQLPGRTPVLLSGGGVGGEAGGVEEDTEVGAKASVPHLSLCFLGSIPLCDIAIEATGRSFAPGPANKFALLSSGGNQQHLLEVWAPPHTHAPANAEAPRLKHLSVLLQHRDEILPLLAIKRPLGSSLDLIWSRLEPQVGSIT